MATAANGFEFIGWSGDATGTNNLLAVTVTTNLSITANFAVIGGNVTLTVITNGEGSISPNLNGREDLKAGRKYTLTPKARSGNVFSNWTGSLTTNKNPLTFRLGSSMVLQANFVTNPFLPLKGTYNGLFFDTTNGVAEQTAGMLKGLAISRQGTYSGTVLINGGSHAISGRFNLAGQATNHISRAASQGGPLTVVMILNWNNSPPQVTGMVFGANNANPWEADLTANFASNTLPPAEYTMLIPPSDNNNELAASSPGGDGYALITNNGTTVRITGALADGTAFSQSGPVSKDGYFPIYANLYAGQGLLLGWINLDLTNLAAVAVSGLTWIHPQRLSGLYKDGFIDVLPGDQILLSPWTNPASAVLANLTNLLILENINGSGTPVAVTVAAGKVTGPLVDGTVNLKTGQLKLSIGSGADKTNIYGAILLDETYGGGYFLTRSNAQAIELGP